MKNAYFYKILFFFTLSILIISKGDSQVLINSTGGTPDGSAMLQIDSDSKGLLPPRMNSQQRDAINSPAVGLMIYNLDDNKMQMFNGTVWNNLEISDCSPEQPGAIAGNIDVCGNVTGETYSILAVPGAGSYIWTVPPGASVFSGNGTNSILVDFGTVSGNISVYATNGCGDGTVKNLAVTVVEPEQPGPISGDLNIYENGYGWYGISAVLGADSYIWTVPIGATIVSGQGTTSIIAHFGTESGSVSVYAVSDCGNSPIQSLAVTVLPIDIGDFLEGGVVFWLNGEGGGLVCAVNDQSEGAEWGCYEEEIYVFETSIGSGASNTEAIITSYCMEPGIAADICANLDLNGYDDWFLPSKDELNEMYLNNAAINLTAVANGGTAFVQHTYWSSSEFGDAHAWNQNPNISSQFSTSKNITKIVRAVRAF